MCGLVQDRLHFSPKLLGCLDLSSVILYQPVWTWSWLPIYLWTKIQMPSMVYKPLYVWHPNSHPLPVTPSSFTVQASLVLFVSVMSQAFPCFLLLLVAILPPITLPLGLKSLTSSQASGFSWSLPCFLITLTLPLAYSHFTLHFFIEFCFCCLSPPEFTVFVDRFVVSLSLY
jgi:hypothetical protein